LLTCAEIIDRCGYEVDAAVAAVSEYQESSVQKEWTIAIFKQETNGVVRPRFEQHTLSRRNAQRSLIVLPCCALGRPVLGLDRSRVVISKKWERHLPVKGCSVP
jgi:hypothetical protein